MANSAIPANNSNPPAWNTWIFQESKRRTLSAVFLFDRAFHFLNGMPPMTCDGLKDTLLPFPKRAWEAASEEEFQSEYAAARKLLDGTEKREWLRLQDLWEGNERMAVWYEGIDSLGSAVMADSVVRMLAEGMKYAGMEEYEKELG